MRIYFNSPQTKIDNLKSLYNTSINNKAQITNTRTDLGNMPNYKYQVNFGAMNSNLENLYKAFGQGKGMPETYNKVLSEMTSSARETITSVYAHYRSIYSPLEECHSVEAIKKLFPTEFERIQSALTRKSNNGSFISKISQWGSLFEGESDKFLFPETKDNDLTVYLTKKLFLEAKTKSEIKADFLKEINKEILSEKDIHELIVTTHGTEAIPDSTFMQLGLQGKVETNGFRQSLLCSRDDFIKKYGSVYHSKRKATFNKTVEAVTSATNTEGIELPKRGSANYEKSQYAMFDVWNNSMDLRTAMSDFLTGKKITDEMLLPDLMSIHTLKIRKDETQIQKSLMQQFWAKHPTLRGEFSNRCQESFEKVEKAIDEGKFEELKKEIDTKRQNTFLEMKALKEARERKILEQQRLAEEKLRIENLNNKIKKDIRGYVEKIREKIAIPQNSMYNTVQYFSKHVQNGEEPSMLELTFKSAGIKAASEVAMQLSFKEIGCQKINKHTEHCLKDMADELIGQGVDKLPKDFKDELSNRLSDVIVVLENAYNEYLLFICNNSSNNPKVKVRRSEMEKITNALLQDSNISKKLELKTQQKLLKRLAFQIAKMPVQDVEQSYTSYYRNALNTLSEYNQ